jgi:hypothetical protein
MEGIKDVRLITVISIPTESRDVDKTGSRLLTNRDSTTADIEKAVKSRVDNSDKNMAS